MKIVFLSDTHGRHRDVTIPNGCDIVIHGGDFSHSGKYNQIEDFFIWWNSLDIKYKVFVAGNHDFLAQTRPIEFYELLHKYSNLGSYLFDSAVIIEGIKIYGSPWQPEFHNWAFNLSSDALSKKWKLIPNDIDILVTHGPPYGILDNTNALIGGSVQWDDFDDSGYYVEAYDLTYGPRRVGCKHLLCRVKEVKPKYHLFGHIHECYGVARNLEKSPTTFINGSLIMDKDIVHQPIEFIYGG